MPYKALMLDVDGTLSPYSTTSLPQLPTQAVAEAVQAAKSRLHIGLATSRPLSKVKPIFDRLSLDGFSILQNGAQIIDAQSLQTVWQRAVPVDALREVYRLVHEFKIQTYYTDFEQNIRLETLDQLLASPVSSILLDGIEQAVYPQVETQLNAFPNITVHKLSSKWPDKYEISVTGCEATKENAIKQLAAFLSISQAEIIGAGDAPNDISLLTACGLKIAMGNAVPEVKALADDIAPSVDEDGVAWIIDKYIINASG